MMSRLVQVMEVTPLYHPSRRLFFNLPASIHLHVLQTEPSSTQAEWGRKVGRKERKLRYKPISFHTASSLNKDRNLSHSARDPKYTNWASKIDVEYGFMDQTETRRKQFQCIFLEILQTCKQIPDEASSILCGCNVSKSRSNYKDRKTSSCQHDTCIFQCIWKSLWFHGKSRLSKRNELRIFWMVLIDTKCGLVLLRWQCLGGSEFFYGRVEGFSERFRGCMWRSKSLSR